MSLRAINLDDRRFEDLMESALARVRESCPDWNDLSPSDPGRALLELFAYLTDVMLYRLNRLPEKAYVEFLRLLGVARMPPSSALTRLEFSLTEPADAAIDIPRDTRVKASGSDGSSVVFTTAADAVIQAGETRVSVIAYHCDMIEAEFLGVATGRPGMSVCVARRPIVATCADYLDLVVGVETHRGDPPGKLAHRHHGGKDFGIWFRSDDFSSCAPGDMIYAVDRATGRIDFAPALRMRDGKETLAASAVALAAVPGEGREIRAWYRTGGGVRGNVAADTLTAFDGPPPAAGLKVTNPEAAAGGRDGETLEHAMQRGPQELRSLRRAVTPHDFESQALKSSGGVCRASAHTQRALWEFAQRGTVEVCLVPDMGDSVNPDRPLTPAELHTRESDLVLEQVQTRLDARRPLGTLCVTRWSNYKNVRVNATITLFRQEDAEEVRRRLLRRLYAMINPATDGGRQDGWGFGQALTSYDVYRLLASEVGVRNVRNLTLAVDDVPDANLAALAADSFQPRTWYAGSDDRIFRTLNDGEGWEKIARFEGETLTMVRAYPKAAAGPRDRAGLVAAATRVEGKDGARVYISRDCGESWESVFRPDFAVEDMAWVERHGEPTLMFATEKALYQLAGGRPIPILVDPSDQTLGFYAIAVSTDVWGRTSVAVAARGRGGVYLSVKGGEPKTFKNVGLKGELVRVLEVQHRGPNRYIWAGTAAIGKDAGSGCFRRELSDRPGGASDWVHYNKNWTAGGCGGIAFLGSKAVAGSRRMGVIVLDVDTTEPAWRLPDVNCGLPLEGLTEFEPIDFVAARATDDHGAGKVLAAGPKGVYHSGDGGITYSHCSQREFGERVTLPQTWLFCSGEHAIDVEFSDA